MPEISVDRSRSTTAAPGEGRGGLSPRPNAAVRRAAARGATVAAPPRVRGATAADIEAVTRFLHGFWPKIPPAAWRALFDHDWVGDKPDLGFVLTDGGGTITGFLATIYADRDTSQGRRRFCNVSSWAVAPKHRAYAMLLAREAIARRDCTITNLSPTSEAQTAFLRLGFEPLDDAKLVWLPFANAGTLRRGARTRIEDDPARMFELLDAGGRRILADHPGCRHLVVEELGALTHVVRIVRRKRGVKVSEILYCSNAALLERVFESVKLHILRRDKTAALAADRRLLGAHAPRGIALERKACYRSADLGAADIDNLYSEYALLPM
jgi:acetoacetyl-CoA synthetase